MRGNNWNIDPGGTYHGPSDVALKDLDGKFEGALDLLDRLAVWQFHWKHDGLPGIGLLAHEVREVLPELVRDNGRCVLDGELTGGVLTLNYSGLIGPLIQAVRELRAEINQLKAR